MWEQDRLKKELRAQKEAEEMKERNAKLRKLLDAQVELLEKKREDLKRIEKEEAELMVSYSFYR